VSDKVKMNDSVNKIKGKLIPYSILLIIICSLWYFSHEAVHNIICHLQGFKACTNFIQQNTTCEGIVQGWTYTGKLLYVIGPYILGLCVVFSVFCLSRGRKQNIALRLLPYAVFLDSSATAVKFIIGSPNSDINALLGYFSGDIFPAMAFIMFYLPTFIIFLLLFKKHDMPDFIKFMSKEYKSEKSNARIKAFSLICIMLIVLFAAFATLATIFSPEIILSSFEQEYFALLAYPCNGCLLHSKALELKGNISNETEISISIAKWVSKNVNYSTNGTCKKLYTDSETLLKRCGPCGEKANLIESLLNSIGINAVSVGTTGENHEWNYIFIDGNPVFIDASGDGGISNYGMPTRDFEKTYPYNLSYVAIYFQNGSVTEVTKDYSDTSLLNVSVLNRQGNPVKNAAIIIRSHSLIESHISNETFESTHCFTGDSSYCVFSLGDGKYTIKAMSTFFNNVVFLLDEENVSLNVNSNITNVVLYSEFDADSLFSIILLAILIATLIITRFICVFLNSVRKKRQVRDFKAKQ